MKSSPHASKPITVLPADDHTVVREGLRALLEAEDDIEVVAEARTGREALRLTKEFHPAVVVMDIAMPMLNGIEAALTSREVEILQLIAEGKANKHMAAELGSSIKTVEKHRQRLMTKLDIHDTAGLTRYAIVAGIIHGDVRLTIE